MLISLRRQLHRLLQQRRGQLLLTLLAALWLALPSAATSSHAGIDVSFLQPANNHCSHHAPASSDIDMPGHSDDMPSDSDHRGSGHHDHNQGCLCAQACHASPVAIVATGLNLPPPPHAAQPLEKPQRLASTLQPPLYRPPIALAA
jgi:hypothetical protein